MLTNTNKGCNLVRDEQIVKDRLSGEKYSEIANKYKISRQRVYQICWRGGVAKRLPPKPHSMYAAVRCRAIYGKLSFTLTREEFGELVSKPCIYGGQGCEAGIRIGLDRIDNSIGYEFHNCAPCCCRHNIRRSNDFTHEEFLDAVKRYPGLKACGNKKRKNYGNS